MVAIGSLFQPRSKLTSPSIPYSNRRFRVSLLFGPVAASLVALSAFTAGLASMCDALASGKHVSLATLHELAVTEGCADGCAPSAASFALEAAPAK